MASTYTTNLRLELQGTGENRGAWGTKANNAYSLLEEAVAGAKTIALADANLTLTTVQGSTDQSRPMFLKFTGVLTNHRTITIPTVSKMYFVQNGTTGNFNLTFTTGSGTTYTVIPNGSPGTQWKLLFTDGASVWSNDSLTTTSSSIQRWDIAPFVSVTGNMEVGQNIDFHNTNTDTNDWNVRLSTSATNTDLYVVTQAGSGRKIWNSGNMGAASGLDADLLDGLHASQIQFVDAPNDGKQYVRKNLAWVAVDTPWSIEVATGDVILKYGANTVIRIKSTGLILTEDDIEVFSVSVG
jgi:hypothetical protein